MAGVGPCVPEVETKNPKQMATTQRRESQRNREMNWGEGEMRRGRLFRLRPTIKM